MSKYPVALARAVAIVGTSFLAGCGGYGGGGDGSPAALSISVNPTTINVGQSATITWNSNGTTCTASGAWMGPKPGDGTEQVSPNAPGTYVYSLTCSGGGYGESDTISATLTVNTTRAAGLWSGQACCVGGATFRVTGVTDDAGDYRFVLLDTHYVGKSGETATAYATSRSSLAGARIDGARGLTMYALAPRDSVRYFLRTVGARDESQFIDVPIPYDASIETTSGAQDLLGSYTTRLATGYTLTMTFDADGRVIGADTNGCGLDGRASRRDTTLNAYIVVLDVSGCGQSNGRYVGDAALAAGDGGEPSELFLSTSNADSAIVWRLSR